MSTFLAGGRLIALNKGKEGYPPDVRPIAVGETLRRLTGKCICAILRDKFSSFFQPSQFGVACKSGAENSLQKCIEKNWLSGDIVAFKVDMTNTFNMVSRQAVSTHAAAYIASVTHNHETISNSVCRSGTYDNHKHLTRPLLHTTNQ